MKYTKTDNPDDQMYELRRRVGTEWLDPVRDANAVKLHWEGRRHVFGHPDRYAEVEAVRGPGYIHAMYSDRLLTPRDREILQSEEVKRAQGEPVDPDRATDRLFDVSFEGLVTVAAPDRDRAEAIAIAVANADPRHTIEVSGTHAVEDLRDPIGDADWETALRSHRTLQAAQARSKRRDAALNAFGAIDSLLRDVYNVDDGDLDIEDGDSTTVQLDTVFAYLREAE